MLPKGPRGSLAALQGVQAITLSAPPQSIRWQSSEVFVHYSLDSLRRGAYLRAALAHPHQQSKGPEFLG